MKKYFYILGIISLMTAYGTEVKAQPESPDCKVLLEAISDEYSGKCKDGLAHGKGVAKGKDTYKGRFKNGLPHGKGLYIWANNDYYHGDWKEGKKHGKGIHYIADEEKTFREIWREDKLIKRTPTLYSIGKKVNVNYVKIKKNQEALKGTILVKLKVHPDKRYRDTVELTGSSGYNIAGADEWVFSNVTFPFQGEVAFRVRGNRFVVTERCIVEFTIYQPGAYDVIIDEDVSNL